MEQHPTIADKDLLVTSQIDTNRLRYQILKREDTFSHLHDEVFNQYGDSFLCSLASYHDVYLRLKGKV